MEQKQPLTLEQKAFIAALSIDFFFAALGFTFAIIVGSNAILLDGMYSLISAIVNIITLKITFLLQRTPNKEYPFGYVMYEPVINLIKGILVAIVIVSALISAVITLINSESHEMNASLALIYSLSSAFVCYIIFYMMHRIAAQSGSTILKVDSRQWLIDGTLSLGVALAFIAVYFLQTYGYSEYAMRADPIMVIVLALVMAPVPITVIRTYWNQILYKSADEVLVTKVESLVLAHTQLLNKPHFHLKVVESGRYVYVHIYFVTHLDLSIKELDTIRRKLYLALAKEFKYFGLDVSFTTEAYWVEKSV